MISEFCSSNKLQLFLKVIRWYSLLLLFFFFLGGGGDDTDLHRYSVENKQIVNVSRCKLQAQTYNPALRFIFYSLWCYSIPSWVFSDKSEFLTAAD